MEEPGPDGLPDGPELTRARARYGLGSRHSRALATQLDGLLASGSLDGADLLHQAAPAVLILAYLSSASRRTGAPPQALAALDALGGLVDSRLGADPAAWERVIARLTGRDPRWNAVSPIADLLLA